MGLYWKKSGFAQLVPLMSQNARIKLVFDVASCFVCIMIHYFYSTTASYSFQEIPASFNTQEQLRFLNENLGRIFISTAFLHPLLLTEVVPSTALNRTFKK